MTQSPSGLHANPSRLQATLRKTLPAMLLRAGLSQDDDHPVRIERAPVPTAPAQMAAAQSPDAATSAELMALYTRCLHTYRDAVRPQDTEQDDVGAALAFFVVANLHALHPVHATQQTLDALERQLRAVARRNAQWDVATRAQRQLYFERIAILGVLMAGNVDKARTQGPAALAELRRTARQYLQQMLGLNPDLLTLGPDGLVMRSR